MKVILIWINLEVRITETVRVLVIQKCLNLKTLVYWPFEELGHFNPCFWAFRLRKYDIKQLKLFKTGVNLAVKVTNLKTLVSWPFEELGRFKHRF